MIVQALFSVATVIGGGQQLPPPPPPAPVVVVQSSEASAPATVVEDVVSDPGPNNLGEPDPGPNNLGEPDPGPTNVGAIDPGPNNIGATDPGPNPGADQGVITDESDSEYQARLMAQSCVANPNMCDIDSSGHYNLGED